MKQFTYSIFFSPHIKVLVTIIFTTKSPFFISDSSLNVQAEIQILSDHPVIWGFQFLIYVFQVNVKDSAYSLALANRSAVSMRLGKQGIKNALSDVDRAIKAGHPTPAKLWERKITCLQELGLFQQVQRNFEIFKFISV